jgi:hypothetical protein
MNTDWNNLIQRYIAGHTTEEETRHLEAAMKADDALADLYLRHTELDVALEASAASAEVMRELLTAPVAPETRHGFAWLSWRPLTAAAAGIVFGMFCTSAVFGFLVRQHTRVQTLLVEGFEDPAMILGRGAPTTAGVWSGDLLATAEAKDDVMPAEGKRMLVVRQQEGRLQSAANRFLDLTSLPPASAGESHQIEVMVRFYGGKPGVQSRLRLRLIAFEEEAAEARKMLANGSVPELTLAHVQKSESMRVGEWNRMRLTIDVPAEAKVLLISMIAGVEPSSLPMPERYLDDVHVRLITQEAPLP